MPNLPQVPNSNNSEIVEKAATTPSFLLHEPVTFKKDLVKGRWGLLMFIIFIMSFSLTLSGYFAFQKVKLAMVTKPLTQVVKTEEFKNPPNIYNIRFPNDHSQKAFMDKLALAKEEKDKSKRYTLLEDTFVMLAGIYSADQSSETRLLLQQYKVYMKQTYPDEVRARDSIYKITCLDLLCGKEAYPYEIIKIRDEINVNNSLSDVARREILDLLKIAALQTEKNVQGGYYLNALSALYSQFEVARNEKTKVSYEGLLAYVQKTYPETKIPDSILVTK